MNAIYVLGILEKDSKILFLLRKNSHFDGYYGLPGGSVETGESIASALVREVREEIGINTTLHDMEFVHCLSFCKPTEKEEYLVLIFKIHQWQGTIVNLEPKKHEEIVWFSYENLPENIVPRHRRVLECVQKGVRYLQEGW